MDLQGREVASSLQGGGAPRGGAWSAGDEGDADACGAVREGDEEEVEGQLDSVE